MPALIVVPSFEIGGNHIGHRPSLSCNSKAAALRRILSERVWRQRGPADRAGRGGGGRGRRDRTCGAAIMGWRRLRRRRPTFAGPRGPWRERVPRPWHSSSASATLLGGRERNANARGARLVSGGGEAAMFRPAWGCPRLGAARERTGRLARLGTARRVQVAPHIACSTRAAVGLRTLSVDDGRRTACGRRPSSAGAVDGRGLMRCAVVLVGSGRARPAARDACALPEAVAGRAALEIWRLRMCVSADRQWWCGTRCCCGRRAVSEPEPKGGAVGTACGAEGFRGSPDASGAQDDLAGAPFHQAGPALRDALGRGVG